MSSLDTIKLKLKRFFVSSVVSPDHLPLRVFTDENDILYQYKDKNTGSLVTCISHDGFSFNRTDTPYNVFTPKDEFPNAVYVPGYENGKARAIYYGDRSIRLAQSLDGVHWAPDEKPVIASAKPLSFSNVFSRHDGNLLVYFGAQKKGDRTHYDAHMALCEKAHPEHVIWKLEEPMWEQKQVWDGKEVMPLGTILWNDKIISYWFVNQEMIYGVVHSGFHFDPNDVKKNQLEKHEANPIIAPNDDNEWESFTTFNPAAAYIDGKVHILYRAQGYDYVSSVGYAVSSDGVTIEMKSQKPVFTPHEGFETNKSSAANYDYMSGGSYGGCEDPRITQMEDKVYMTYVAFDGWSPPRLALTSIGIDDFLAQRWNWEKPVLISPPGVIDKSGCLLPEKINGKYVFFHRVFPNIQIDFVDNLDFDGKTRFLTGQYEIKVRPDKWDSRKIGAGAPPIKTEDGWLLIYYGVDDRDDSKYLIGAMLLDLEDPTKVLYRSDYPIVEPIEQYENVGFKPGIVYPCGAVLIEDKLMVYYGGADSHVCVATADIHTFLSELKLNRPIHLHTFDIRELSYRS